MLLCFTDQAQMAMRLAAEEARRVHHEYFGTEHVLLGLVREIDGLASKVLRNIGIELLDVREDVLNIVGFGPDQQIKGMQPYTPQAQAALTYAMEEAQNLHDRKIGTVQLLLGILREKQGVAAQILEDFGVDFELLRTKILDLLVQGFDDRVSKETFDTLVGPEENAIRVHRRRKRMQRPKIKVSVIPVRTAWVEGFSMVRTAQMAKLWHGEYVAKYGHAWSNDWDEQLALSLQGKNGAALQRGFNRKWYPWWKRLLQKLSTDGIFESPDSPEKWQIRE